MRFKSYLNESYTNKIQGIPKNAFDYFNMYKKEFDVKELGFKKLNVSKVSVGSSFLGDKQLATVANQFGVDHNKMIRDLKKLIPMVQNKWNEVQKQAHMETYGKEPSFGDYKVSGIGDSSYPDKYKKELRTLAHMETAFKSALRGHELAKKGM